MKLQQVSKEIALQLKELGFDWIKAEVDELWLCHNEVNKNYEKIKYILPSDLENSWFIPVCSIPTQALVVKWFRKVHNIDIIVNPMNTVERKCYTTDFFIGKYRDGYPNVDETFEEAEEAGILYAIELIKESINQTNKQ